MISKTKHYCRLCFTTVSCNKYNNEQNNLIVSSLCKQKRYHEALQTFYTIQTKISELQLYPSTYAQLFHACSNVKSLCNVHLVHRHLQDSGVFVNVILYNHILNTYGKCGSLDDALQVFNKMPERNVVSWTSIISGCSQNCREGEALELYIGMLRSGLSSDHFALGSVIRACSKLLNVEVGTQLHCHAVKLDFGSNRIVQNALVTMYAKLNRIGDASVIFKRIADKDVISWGSMIAGYAQQGFELEALQTFREMFCMGNHRPNEFHFGSVFSACGSLLELACGEQLHGLCLKFGLERDEFSGCSLSDMYARFRMLDCTKKAFYDIGMPDLVSWNSILTAFSSQGLANETMTMFMDLRSLDLVPDDVTIRSLLCACIDPCNLKQGEVIHSYTVRMGWLVNFAICNSLLMMYSKCSDLSTAFILFREIGDKDLVSWNTMLNSCLQHQELDEVFRLVKLMLGMDYKVDHITLNAILNACAAMAFLDMGNQIHAHALKIGLETDMMVRNSLIDTYAKCGSLDDARRLFELMKGYLDVFSCSSLIVGYAQFGRAKQSLQLFTSMQSLGIKPNHVTFVGVLTACSRFALLDEGLYYFNMMTVDYGILPTREHCSCIIDLLARAGRISEAEEFMNKMPFEPDIIMWKTLLSACRMHKNVEIGKRAAENILRIDPQNSSAFVLLCNMYASAGCWDELAMLRTIMKRNDIKKSPGKSWIKIKGKDSVFTVDDMTHPESPSIFSMLELLWLQMVEADYDAESLNLPELYEPCHAPFALYL